MQEKQRAHAEDKAMGCFKMIFLTMPVSNVANENVFFLHFICAFVASIDISFKFDFYFFSFFFSLEATLRFYFTFILTGFIKFWFLKYLHVKQILFLKANFLVVILNFWALFYCFFFNLSGTKQSTNMTVSGYREVNSLLIHTSHLRMWVFFLVDKRGSALQITQKRNMYYLRTY